MLVVIILYSQQPQLTKSPVGTNEQEWRYHYQIGHDLRYMSRHQVWLEPCTRFCHGHGNQNVYHRFEVGKHWRPRQEFHNRTLSHVTTGKACVSLAMRIRWRASVSSTIPRRESNASSRGWMFLGSLWVNGTKLVRRSSSNVHNIWFVRTRNRKGTPPPCLHQ